MRTFSQEPVASPKCPHETVPMVFYFGDELTHEEILASVTSATVTMAQGFDEDPQALIEGTPERDGSFVTVLATGGVDGAYYRVEVLAVTDSGRTVSRSAVLPVIEL